MSRYLLPALLLLAITQAKSQNFILPSGEYMDTTTAHNPACGNGAFVRYYSVNGKYPRSSETLVKEARAFLQQKQRVYTGSGYVTFRFVVDCAGRRQPRTQVLQTDTNYQRFHFRKELVAELYAYLQSLTEWQIAKAPQPLSYLAYVTFKIKNGEVIAVIP